MVSLIFIIGCRIVSGFLENDLHNAKMSAGSKISPFIHEQSARRSDSKPLSDTQAGVMEQLEEV